MDLSLFFLGTAGSVPSARRGLPAVLIRRGGDRLLFDCGEGTQRQLLRSVGLLDLDTIFITHFHADHWLGLPGMLKSFALRERTEPLTVYGPPGLSELMGVMRVVYGRLAYELKIVELDPAQAVDYDGYPIAAIPVRHKGAASFGYALVEDARPGHLDAALAEQLGVRPGPDFGRLQRGRDRRRRAAPSRSWVRPARGARSSSPATPRRARRSPIAAHQADVLVHEATFAEEEAERARQTLHSTARQAAELARDAEVRLLALTHVSSRYAGRRAARGGARGVRRDRVAARLRHDRDPVPRARAPRRCVRWSERQARERAVQAEDALAPCASRVASP